MLSREKNRYFTKITHFFNTISSAPPTQNILFKYMSEHSNEDPTEFSPDSISEFDKLTLQMFSNKTHCKNISDEYTIPYVLYKQYFYIFLVGFTRVVAMELFLVVFSSFAFQILQLILLYIVLVP
jgi:hypothetical protein